MTSHRIHLRGPWDYMWLVSSTDELQPASKSGTVTMPQSWQSVFGEVSGTAQFERKFHRPTNLDPHETVFIILTEVRGSGTVRLNNQPVGSFSADGTSAEFDVTKLLEPFSELVVEITFRPDPVEPVAGGLFGAVALEIRSA